MTSDFRVVPATYKPRSEKLRGDKGMDWNYFWRCLLGTGVFTLLAYIPVYVSRFIPDIDTGKYFNTN